MLHVHVLQKQSPYWPIDSEKEQMGSKTQEINTARACLMGTRCRKGNNPRYARVCDQFYGPVETRLDAQDCTLLFRQHDGVRKVVWRQLLVVPQSISFEGVEINRVVGPKLCNPGHRLSINVSACKLWCIFSTDNCNARLHDHVVAHRLSCARKIIM